MNATINRRARELAASLHFEDKLEKHPSSETRAEQVGKASCSVGLPTTKNLTLKIESRAHARKSN